MSTNAPYGPTPMGSGGTGYTCYRCNAWVPYNTAHSCWQVAPAPQTVDMLKAIYAEPLGGWKKGYDSAMRLLGEATVEQAKLQAIALAAEEYVTEPSEAHMNDLLQALEAWR